MQYEQPISQETIDRLKDRVKQAVDFLTKALKRFMQALTRAIAVAYRKTIPAARVYLKTKNRRIKSKSRRRLFAHLIREAAGNHGKAEHAS